MALSEKACYSAKVRAKSEKLTILQSVLPHPLGTPSSVTSSGKAGMLRLRLQTQNVCMLTMNYFRH